MCVYSIVMYGNFWTFVSNRSTSVIMKGFLWISLCFTLLASCAGETYYAENSANNEIADTLEKQVKTQASQAKGISDNSQSPLLPAMPNIQLTRLGEPSLVWREGETTILQFAGTPDDKRVPDCTLLVFLDVHGQPTGLHSRNPSVSGVNTADDYADNAACFKAWSKFKKRQYRG